MEEENELVERLTTSSQFFEEMLTIIPPDHYFHAEIDETEWASRFQHNKKGKAPKQAIKEASKKAKKARLDPSTYKSVPEIQREEHEKKKVEHQETE